MPLAYICPASRQTCVTCTARTRLNPITAVPRNSGSQKKVRQKANSIIAIPLSPCLNRVFRGTATYSEGGVWPVSSTSAAPAANVGVHATNVPRCGPLGCQTGINVLMVMVAVTFSTLPALVAPGCPVTSLMVVGEKYCTVMVPLLAVLMKPTDMLV